MLAMIIALFCFTSCQDTLSDAKVAEIEKKITEITDYTLDRFNERDTANCYSFYSDDFTGLSRGRLFITPDQWNKFKTDAKKSVTTRAEVNYTITGSRVDVLAVNVVNHHFTYTRKILLGDGMSYESPVACTWTYLREGEIWKIRNAHISYPKEYFQAAENDRVFFAFLNVHQDMKEEFERITHELIFDKASETDQVDEMIMGKTRILHPVKDNDDGTATYLVMIDPMYEGEYEFTTKSLLTKIYGEEEDGKLNDQLDKTLAGSQTSYLMTQSRH